LHFPAAVLAPLPLGVSPRFKVQFVGGDLSCRLPRRTTLSAQNSPATPSDDDGGGVEGDAGQAHLARGPGGAAGGLAVPQGGLHEATIPHHEARRAPVAGGAGRAVRAPRRARHGRHGACALQGRRHGHALLPEPLPPKPHFLRHCQPACCILTNNKECIAIQVLALNICRIIL
jgi:hypothetical protein